MPVTIVIVDTEERIHEYLPEIDELVSEALVTSEQVQVRHRTTDKHKTQPVTS
ncbi:DUF190 domain-containing protein [Actinomadura sp. B10D3]|uniref:DUF190 domain-containing protein n=1 Tax=Actinomadura sp. B10D3 TaxID=3153557 RepID=UPI00325DD82B